MKLQELYESLSDPYEFKVTQTLNRSYVAKFSTKDGEVEFGAAPSDEHNRIWEIAFSRKSTRGSSDFGVTGQGDEFKVFATIFAIVKDFVRIYSPDKIEFTAEKTEVSRARLYEKFVKRFKLDGYKADTNKSESDYRVYFSLKKISQNADTNTLKLSSNMRHRD